MNPNELKMLIALQPMIKKAVGKLRIKDNVAFEDGYTGFISRIKDIQDGGYVYAVWKDGIKSCDIPEDAEKYFIRIPPPIDPENPERGLWGMLDWKQWACNTTLHGNLVLHDGVITINSTPTEAILKALCAQWEVKI